MPRNTEDLDWQSVDTDSFTGPLAKTFKAYEESREETKLAREILEEQMAESKAVRKACPAGYAPRFGFKWGKVTMAFAPKSGAKKSTTGFQM